ncbi:hypothetical protein VNO77_43226 [Canavalia gladiata]|uniref:Uncharacterized protein n=1 Tax=Canavalia gladiata TaxID=3824 RepID=A0AAN9JUF2_CANGL
MHALLYQVLVLGQCHQWKVALKENYRTWFSLGCQIISQVECCMIYVRNALIFNMILQVLIDNCASPLCPMPQNFSTYVKLASPPSLA